MRRSNVPRRWVHRHGIARIPNERHGATGFRGAYVQTALPIPVLARYVAGRYGRRVESRDRVGLFAWRWQLRP